MKTSPSRGLRRRVSCCTAAKTSLDVGCEPVDRACPFRTSLVGRDRLRSLVASARTSSACVRESRPARACCIRRGFAMDAARSRHPRRSVAAVRQASARDQALSRRATCAARVRLMPCIDDRLLMRFNRAPVACTRMRRPGSGTEYGMHVNSMIEFKVGSPLSQLFSRLSGALRGSGHRIRAACIGRVARRDVVTSRNDPRHRGRAIVMSAEGIACALPACAGLLKGVVGKGFATVTSGRGPTCCASFPAAHALGGSE